MRKTKPRWLCFILKVQVFYRSINFTFSDQITSWLWFIYPERGQLTEGEKFIDNWFIKHLFFFLQSISIRRQVLAFQMHFAAMGLYSESRLSDNYGFFKSCLTAKDIMILKLYHREDHKPYNVASNWFISNDSLSRISK